MGSYSVAVITLDFESSNLSSNLGRSWVGEECIFGVEYLEYYKIEAFIAQLVRASDC